jgi:hypothetical protein
VVKLKLRRTGSYGSGGWGFRVDQIVTSVDNPGIVQSNHPYNENGELVLTITNSEINARSTRVHFNRIGLGSSGDFLQVLDSNDVVIQTFDGGTNKEDIWSEYVPGRVVKLKLRRTGSYGSGGWGFRVDATQSR